MNLINKQFYKGIKFYLSIGAAVTCLLATIIYLTVTSNIELTANMNTLVIIFPIVAIVVYVAFAAFRPLEFFSSFVSWALIFACFITYIATIYMYFAGVFYNGFSVEAIFTMDPGVLISIILFLVALIAGNVAIYLPIKDNKENN